MCMNMIEQRIRKWMRAVLRNNYEDYFDMSEYTMDWARITKLGEECSAHFGFKENSVNDELCFENAIVVLEQFCDNMQ